MVTDTTATGVRALLASNLRRLRVARHLSLSELARLTGMSKATLSGIEAGRANPTAETLASLAHALRVRIAELLEATPGVEMRIVRAGREHRVPDRVRARMLEAMALEGDTEVFELGLPAGKVHEAPARAKGARTLLLVLQGKLIAGPVERISELTSGDYASFPADVPHIYEAVRAPARALVVAYTPS
jgi:transcriptional regulator with XRE-family HTH domain